MQVFLLGKDIDELLSELLVARGALCDAERLARATQQCGPVPPGHNFVPDVSPLEGGKDDSFHVATAEGHVRKVVADWQSTQARTHWASTVRGRAAAHRS